MPIAAEPHDLYLWSETTKRYSRVDTYDSEEEACQAGRDSGVHWYVTDPAGKRVAGE